MAFNSRALPAALLLTMLTAACADAQQPRPSQQSRPTQQARSTQQSNTCIVARIADGDTIGCEGGARVRLLLIDTPELDQGTFGRTAAAALGRLAPVGTSLRLEFDVRRTDQYNRLLAYAWTADGTMINEQMVREGMAVVLVYPPNVKYVDRLRAAADLAKRRKIGLWATSAFECAPRDHRAGRC